MAVANPPEYSGNEVFDGLEDRDPTVEIIGYVDSIEGRKQYKNYVLFKFVITNGDRKITCLIWGDQLINQYQQELTLGRIICLDGVRSKAALLNNNRREQGFVPFELVLQANTIVSYYGLHVVPAVVQPPQPEPITFEEIGYAEGLIYSEIEDFLIDDTKKNVPC